MRGLRSSRGYQAGQVESLQVRTPMKLFSRLLALSSVIFAVICAAPAQQAARILFPVEKDDKWGFIDRTGKIVIPLQFASANDFHEGLALVTANHQTMFIDMTGKTVFMPKFDIVNSFSEGLAAVNIGQKRIPNIGLISDPGKWGY